MNALQIINQQEKHLAGPATWDAVKYWADLSAKFSHASVAAQVMAGFALNELHKAHEIKPGKPKNSEKANELKLPNDSVITNLNKSWPDLVKEQAGISADTARNWMNMAQGVKARWKKLAPQDRLKALMAVSPSQWSDKDMKLVCDSLHKVTDGKSQLDFMRELGLAKKAQGSGATGRAPGEGGRRKLSISEQAELLKTLAVEDWAGIVELLKGYRGKFTVLKDDSVQAQMAVLERHLKARRAWLNQPRNNRVASSIEDIFDQKV